MTGKRFAYPSLLLHVFALVLAGVGVSGCRSRSENPIPRPAGSQRGFSRLPASPVPSVPVPATAPEARPPAVVQTDWCTDTVSALDSETCYALPETPAQELLVYLPGIVPDTPSSPQKTKVMRVASAASTRAGVAVLIPRGLKGLAGKRHRGWLGWPTSEASYRRLVKPIVGRLERSCRALERLAGRKFQRHYVAGSSSGAYFVSLLALHGDMRADGYGAMSGGSGHRTPEISSLKPVPFYIGVGQYDSVVAAARGLGTLLTQIGWPVNLAIHPFGHGAREVYLDEAFEFWRGAARDRDASG